jgi:hypothetical protein
MILTLISKRYTMGILFNHFIIKYEYIKIDTCSMGLEIYKNNRKLLNFFDICEKTIFFMKKEYLK